MASFRETREALLLAFNEDWINDEEFVLFDNLSLSFASISISTYRIAPRYSLIFKIFKKNSPVGIDLLLRRYYGELALPKVK